MSKTAFIFPGQGAQAAGMGKDFYEAYPKAAEIYDMASDLLKLDMKALCFEGNDKLDLTEYTQAALVTTCLAMEKVLEEAGVKPDITAGLSLGEYCAIHAAGGMSAADAIRTVRERGILMQDTVPAGEGGMAAVLGMEAAAIEEGLQGIEGAWIANYNCPGQIVITGRKAAVEKASQVLKEKGARRVLPLNVSGPFHSPMLEPAGEKTSGDSEPGGIHPSADPLRYQRDGGAGDGHPSYQRAAEAAGIFLCALAAEHGVYAGKRSGYLCGDRTGQDPDGLPAEDRPQRRGLSGGHLRRYGKSGFGLSLTGGARWQRKKLP